MPDFPYAESFRGLRDEILLGLDALKAKERNLRKWFGRLASAEPGDAVRLRLRLRGIARRHVLSPDELFTNTDRAAALEFREIAAVYLLPFAAKAGRLVLHAFDDTNVDKTSAPRLWGTVAAAERPGRGDQAAAAFFYRVILPVVSGADANTGDKAFRAVSDLAAACDKLGKLIQSEPNIAKGLLGDEDRAKAIEDLESSTPKLDTEDGQWVTNKVAAKLVGKKTATLSKYRREDLCNETKTFGMDRAGRIWRREGMPASHPWYLRNSLK